MGHKKIVVETSCLSNKYSGIGKAVSMLIQSLKELDYEVVEINPSQCKIKSNIYYFGIFIPEFCKREMSEEDIFLIPNNMGKFWRLPHVKTWVLMHDLIPLSKYGYTGLIKFLYRFKINKIKNADRVITISHYVKKTLCDLIKLDENRVRVLYWPITVCDTNNTKRDTNQFISIGTGEPRKNVEFIINAWKEVSPPGSKLLLYGAEWKKGESYKYLQAIIRKNDLSNNVKIIGRISETDLSKLYSTSRALIYPSLEEGFGLPPLEALSLGCNIILPKLPVNFELYSHIAHFYDAGNVAELKEAIESSGNINELKNIEFSNRFSIEVFKQDIIKVFN